MVKNIGLFLLFLVLGFTVTLFYFNSLIWPQTKNISQQQKTKTDTTEFSLEKAPSQSLSGNLLSLSGNVGWQSRIATEPAQLTTIRSIQQGEKIVTYDNGNVSLGFGNNLLVTVSPKTELELIQTLPTNFVLWQDQGSATYTKTDMTPLAVRNLNLLTQIGSGSANISVNKKAGTVIVKVNKGEATVAYNNINYVTQLETVKAGNRLIFNDKTRTTEIKQ